MTTENYNLQQLKQLIEKSKNTLVITSTSGFAENALPGEIKSIQGSNWKICLISAETKTDIELLSHDIIRQASPDIAENSLPIVSQVHKYLEISAHAKTIPVIIINNAHKLNLDVLEYILELGELRYSKSQFRILLIADNSITPHLQSPKLKHLLAGVQQNIHITNTTDGKISVNKKMGDEPSTDTDTQEVDVTQTPIFSTGKLIVGLGLLAVFSLIFYFNQQPTNDSAIIDSSTSTQQEINNDYNQVEQIVSEQLPAIDDAQEHTQETPQETTEEFTDVPTEESHEALGQDTQDLISNDQLELDQEVSQFTTESDTEDDISQTTPDSQETEIDETVIASSEDITDEEDETEIPLTDISQNTAAAVPTLIEEIEDNSISEATNENVFNLDDIPDYLSQIKGPDWIKEQAESAYVLQLISAQNIANLQELLINQSEIYDPLSGYVKYTPSGKPRYLLLYGIYPDAETAQAAIDKLPSKLKSISPWPRSIQNVVTELNTISIPSKDYSQEHEKPVIEVARNISKNIAEVENPVVAENVFNLGDIPEFLSRIKGSAWIRQQNSDAYVLQLISARQISDLEKLLGGLGDIQDQLSGYVNYTPSGKPRYLLLYGIYPDADAAQDGMKEMPNKLKSIPPWPRKINHVIKELDTITAIN